MTEHVPTTEKKPAKQLSLGTVLANAGKRALGGGIPGAIAMFMQVTTLMWMRTAMNFQYRHGMSTTEALKKLYAEGGIPRFYRGYTAAIFQGPLSRFGDTAANSGVLAFYDAYPSLKELPVWVKTLTASTVAGGIRIGLMPVDTVKTIMQVEGKNGFPMLMNKIKTSGPSVMFHGSIGAATATMVGHFPWFYTYNQLNAMIPVPQSSMWHKLLRNAGIGFSASVISDTISNSLRVIKTTKQTSEKSISYKEAFSMVVEKDGIKGLLGRGLKTRLLANGMQGMMFTVIWKGLEDSFFNKRN